MDHSTELRSQTERIIHVGDTIKCANSDDAIYTMHELAKEGIETDFLYEKDGQKGLWLEVLKVGEQK